MVQLRASWWDPRACRFVWDLAVELGLEPKDPRTSEIMGLHRQAIKKALRNYINESASRLRTAASQGLLDVDLNEAENERVEEATMRAMRRGEEEEEEEEEDEEREKECSLIRLSITKAVIQRKQQNLLESLNREGGDRKVCI